MAPGEVYGPLDETCSEIRLFTLLPAVSHDHPLEGVLESASLASPIPYQALSYAWGELPPTLPITINGQECRIGPNLDTALRGIRRTNSSQVLWVDALCINQSSTSERSQQVGLMKTIYEQCTQDLLWLGSEPGNTAGSGPQSEDVLGRGMNLMERIVRRDAATLEQMERQMWLDFEKSRKFQRELLRVRTEKGRMEGSNEKDDKTEEAKQVNVAVNTDEKKDSSAEQQEANIDPDERVWGWGKVSDVKNGTKKWKLSSEDQSALYELFKYPTVWNRLWVMQELSCAPKVLLVTRNHTLEWNVISDFLGDTPYADAFHGTFSHGMVHPMTSTLFDRIQTIDHQRGIVSEVRHGGHSKLLDVLARFRSAKSRDPRDMIYGLLGLTTDTLDIMPDYSKSVQQVYADVTASVINHAGNLDIVCQSPWSPSRRPNTRYQMETPFVGDLPSWVANFQMPGDVRLFAQRSIFNAGKPSCEVPCRMVNWNILQTKGFIVGRIGAIKQHDYSYELPEPSLDAISARWDRRDRLPLEWIGLYVGHDVLTAPQHTSPYVTGESAFTAFWRTLLTDCTGYPIKRLTAQEITDTDPVVRKVFLETLSAFPERHDSGESHSTLDVDYEWFPDSAMGRMWDRTLEEGWTFAMTGNGLYTLITPAAREDDVVACLDGGKVPLVLRPVQNDNMQGHYTVIGVAYVHGLMDQESCETIRVYEQLQLKNVDIWLA
ncbi:hypothetical protein AB5N19_06951 [Seiridium cardinale]